MITVLVRDEHPPDTLAREAKRLKPADDDSLSFCGVVERVNDEETLARINGPG